MKFELKPIGRIHSPHQLAQGTPIQPRWAAGIEGRVEIFSEFTAGLRDLEGFERIWLVFWCDRANEARLEVMPYRDSQTRGVFATRAPCRPNPIGLSSVRLLAVEGAVLRVADVDILDGTPLLDIKPYLPDCDVFPVKRIGWYDNASGSCEADNRFMRSKPEAKP
jgi:tRNA (adenine37-N6)-methyltransferase